MKIFYGPKGSGKTNQAIDSANAASLTAMGHVLFVSDNSKNMYDLRHDVRFIDAGVFGIKDESTLRGFLRGLVAANADNGLIYIDSIRKIAQKETSELADVFDDLEYMEEKFGVEFAVTVSGTKETLPEFIVKHID